MKVIMFVILIKVYIQVDIEFITLYLTEIQGPLTLKHMCI